jgi:hypothetical protein
MLPISTNTTTLPIQPSSTAKSWAETDVVRISYDNVAANVANSQADNAVKSAPITPPKVTNDDSAQIVLTKNAQAALATSISQQAPTAETARAVTQKDGSVENRAGKTKSSSDADNNDSAISDDGESGENTSLSQALRNIVAPVINAYQNSLSRISTQENNAFTTVDVI